MSRFNILLKVEHDEIPSGTRRTLFIKNKEKKETLYEIFFEMLGE